MLKLCVENSLKREIISWKKIKALMSTGIWPNGVMANALNCDANYQSSIPVAKQSCQRQGRPPNNGVNVLVKALIIEKNTRVHSGCSQPTLNLSISTATQTKPTTLPSTLNSPHVSIPLHKRHPELEYVARGTYFAIFSRKYGSKS